jgi:hypothetical protein
VVVEMGKKKNKMKRKSSKLGTVHHSLAIFYYLLMIVGAISLMIYLFYIKDIIDPYLQQFVNSTGG